jgi:predicted phage gp36 major capsid-like protein
MGMREGTGLTVLRDPYTNAKKGWVDLWVWFDAVYGVLQAEAIQYATNPSA